MVLLFAVMQVNYAVFLYLNIDLPLDQLQNYKTVNIIYMWFCIIFYGVMIWFIWNKIPINKDRKQTLMLLVVLLGIIGIPFWNTDEE